MLTGVYFYNVRMMFTYRPLNMTFVSSCGCAPLHDIQTFAGGLYVPKCLFENCCVDWSYRNEDTFQTYSVNLNIEPLPYCSSTVCASSNLCVCVNNCELKPRDSVLFSWILNVLYVNHCFFIFFYFGCAFTFFVFNFSTTEKLEALESHSDCL